MSVVLAAEKRELPSGQRWQTQDLLPKGFAGSNPASRINACEMIKQEKIISDNRMQMNADNQDFKYMELTKEIIRIFYSA